MDYITKVLHGHLLAARSWPSAGEDTWVGAHGLSIKLGGQGVDGEGNIRMEEALHGKRPSKKGSLGKVFMLG